MQDYKKEFVEFLLDSGALKFGEFKLKSGRLSPYFLDMRVFSSGEAMGKLGFFYASEIKNSKADFDVIFGPAYAGISLALATTISLSRDFGINKKYSFNRKEAKDYGEANLLLGHKISGGDRVMIIDDVFTTGAAKEEALNLINAIAKVQFVSVLIALNRQEVGEEGKSAIKEFEKKYRIPVKSIISIKEVIDFLHNKKVKGKVYIDDAIKSKLDEYLDRYGVK